MRISYGSSNQSYSVFESKAIFRSTLKTNCPKLKPKIILLILMCSGNVRLSRRSPLEGMFPRAGSSLLLLMLSSLDIPICKIQNAPRACYGGTYEDLKNFKPQKGKRSLQPRGRLAGMSESRRAVIHVRAPHICSRRCRQGPGDVNPNAEATTKAGSTLIL